MWTVLKLPELIRSDFICSGILEMAYFRQNQLYFRLYNGNKSHSTTMMKSTLYFQLMLMDVGDKNYDGLQYQTKCH